MANHDFFPAINGENGDATRLSEGYRVLYALAAVMAVASVPTPGNDADFIILDEPTQKLDPNFRQQLAQFLGAYCPKQLIFMTYEDTFANNVKQYATAQGKTVRDFTLDWTLNSGTTWQPTPGDN
jgi:ATPase subunit of ABC transporter with duplicated ATPase domains